MVLVEQGEAQWDEQMGRTCKIDYVLGLKSTASYLVPVRN